MKVFLVPVADRPESQVATDIAFGLADHLEASVIGAYLRPHRDASKAYRSRALPLFGSADEAALRELSRKGSVSAMRATKAMFGAAATAAEFTHAKGPRVGATRLAVWQEMVGSPDILMEIAGPMADLVVVSRPTAKARLGRAFVLAALMHSGRPVLVLPRRQAHVPGKRIAIAWNQSAEASRTVAACMPLLRAAEQVSIITCGNEDRRGPKARDLANYLKYWDVKAQVQRTKGLHEEDELLQTYKDTRSDLLIMGAYSRSRLRELVLGGMTEKMLWHSNIPVLLHHS